jgi:hypothetical protein
LAAGRSSIVVHIHNNSIASLFQQLQASASGSSTSSTTSSSFGLQLTGQNLPTLSSSLAPTPLSATPSSQFASNILSALMSAQTQPNDQTIAGQIISAINPNGDGSLDLSQVEQALTGSSATTSPQQQSIANAFAQLDTNADGSLSQGELANALQSLQQGDPTQGADGAGGHHHHHHAMQAESASATTPTSSSSNASTGSSTTTGGATTTTGGTTAGVTTPTPTLAAA